MWSDVLLFGAFGVISFCVWYVICRLIRRKTRKDSVLESFAAAGCMMFLTLFEVILA